MKKTISLLLVLVLALTVMVGVGSSQPAYAEQEELKWPERDVNIILGYGAGGDSDISTRYMADALSKELGVNVIVTNMSGANGSLAAAEVMNTTDPEYTFLVINTVSISANVATGLVDYNYEAFDPAVIFASYSGETLYVPADAPYDDLQGFIDYAKENSVILGVPTGGGLYAAACAMRAAGLQLEMVDGGDGEARLPSLLAGTFDATFASYSIGRDYVESGSVKDIATLCSNPVSADPDMDCVRDALPGIALDTKFVIMAQKGTDPAILQKINDALQNAYLTNEEYVENIENHSFQTAKPMTIEETLEELENQYQTFQTYKQYLG